MTKYLLVIIMLINSIIYAAPIISQDNNLLSNGSFESGNYNSVTGHSIGSAASNWNQWSNSGGTLTTELITESEMVSNYGVALHDGSSALKVTTSGSGDGPYTMNSWHTNWSQVSSSAVPFTFSGWVYVVSGSMYLAVGSNQTGYSNDTTVKTEEWEFVSSTRSSGTVNELLLYATQASVFIVDSIWLNQGSTSSHPNQIGALGSTIPETQTYLALILSLLFIYTAKILKIF